MKRHPVILSISCIGFVGCATISDEQVTLAKLEQVQPDIEDVYLGDSLERAAQSYRKYLDETTESARTPEAMRRLADLQIEQEYGVIGIGQAKEMAAPDAAAKSKPIAAEKRTSDPIQLSESEQDFERRATQRQQMLSATSDFDEKLALDGDESPASGPRSDQDVPEDSRNLSEL